MHVSSLGALCVCVCVSGTCPSWQERGPVQSDGAGTVDGDRAAPRGVAASFAEPCPLTAAALAAGAALAARTGDDPAEVTGIAARDADTLPRSSVSLWSLRNPSAHIKGELEPRLGLSGCSQHLIVTRRRQKLKSMHTHKHTHTQDTHSIYSVHGGIKEPLLHCFRLLFLQQ